MTEKKKTFSLQSRSTEALDDKNKERVNYLGSRSSARSFIRNKATKKDLQELKILIEERERLLED